MKKKLCALLLSASMLSSLAVPAFAVDASETNAPPRQTDGEDVVYLGVKDYGTVTKDDKENFVHRFSVDGKEKEFTIPADGGKLRSRTSSRRAISTTSPLMTVRSPPPRWKRAMWPVF